MSNMRNIILSTVNINDMIAVTLKNGKEISGNVVSLDEDLLCIEHSSGKQQPISYEIIGTYEIIDADEKCHDEPVFDIDPEIKDTGDSAVADAAMKQLSPSAESPTDTEEPVAAEEASPSESEEADDLLPGQAEGIVESLNIYTNFGKIRGDDGTTYQFILKNIREEDRTLLAVGKRVRFFKGKVYSGKQQKYVDSAEDITVINQPVSKQYGYIVLFMAQKNHGYIVPEEKYPEAPRGDIYFDPDDIIGAEIPNTFQYHYKVSFTYADAQKKRAENIEILEAIPINTGEKKDIEKLDFVEGETLFINLKNNNKIVGEYISLKDATISIKASDGVVTAAVADIEELWFCGLVTDFNILGQSGHINRVYPFRIANVINKQLIHRLKLGKYLMHPCMYSIIIDRDKLYIDKVDYFPKEILGLLAWSAGRISGLYRENGYFSVNKDYRCYESSVSDNAILTYITEKDFLEQEVFFKTITHRTVDERRKDALSYTVVDIRSKYQIGKVLEQKPGQKDVQCGAQVYPSAVSIDVSPETAVKAELSCAGYEPPVVAAVDCDDLSLPSYKEKLQNEKAEFAEKARQAGEDGDYELQIRLNEELLERGFIYPQQAFGTIFKICVSHNMLQKVSELIKNYGYQISKQSLNGYMMQLEYLEGRYESAADYAKMYLERRSDNEFLCTMAGFIIQHTVTPEVLREHILSYTPSKHEGKIGYFNNPTKGGYIIWEEGKLNFSHKDIIDYDGEKIDPEEYDYIVSFDIDQSNPIPKANNVQIKKKSPRGGIPAEGWQEDSEVFFERDEIGDVRVTTLLEFARDNFDLDSVTGYLTANDRKKIREGVFKGTADEAKPIIESLYKASRNKTVPMNMRPSLLLAAAKLHQQVYQNETRENDVFWTKENGEEFLFKYAFKYLKTDGATERAEIEYYCESVFLNGFDVQIKYQMKAICLLNFFEGTEHINPNECKTRSSIEDILKRKCKDISGLIKMLFNLPEQVFEELIDCSPDSLLEEIAEELSGNDDSNTDDYNSKEIIMPYINQYRTDMRKFPAPTGLTELDGMSKLLRDLEEAEEGVGKHMFDADKERLGSIIKIVNTIANSLSEDLDSKINQLENVFGQIKSIVHKIETRPSRVSFELMRPLVLKIRELLHTYLKLQYKLCRPVLTVGHYMLRDGTRESIEIANNQNCLPASNIRLKNIIPFGASPKFEIDRIRTIENTGHVINGGKSTEFSIPIKIEPDAPDVLELSLDLTYEFKSDYDVDMGVVEYESAISEGQQIQIPRKINESDLIHQDGNKYKEFASGDVLDPTDDRAKEMFFGRTEDINEIYQMIVNSDDKLKTGSIVAIYGQKRCGKTSLMNFLGQKIKDNYKDAIVLPINIQEIGCDNGGIFFRQVLSKILLEFRSQVDKMSDVDELKSIMEKNQINIPTTRDILSEGGDIYFSEFFRRFRSSFRDRYPIILMVDEFTQIYIHMKQHKINEDFLNRWRAMIHENGFVNIIVGQDFMDKFTTDKEVTSQNYGGAVNGLGTTGKKRISYLKRRAAKEMVVDPIRFDNGDSRYKGRLGEEAIARIYDLTGGSAFYLMKFCNALVDYMIKERQLLVSVSLVNHVAIKYVFDTPNNPINKTDFDPIFNEYSYSGDDSSEANAAQITEQVKEETDNTYKVLKEIADNSDSQGICALNKLRLDEKKRQILRSLMVRGVLTDPQGRDITSDRIENLMVKIKVQLFAIWLRERG